MSDGIKEPRSEFMLQWFGEHWGAPICDEAAQCAVPVGATCASCNGRIADTDCGLVMPVVSDEQGINAIPWHLGCFLEHVGVEDG